ncbi:MAG: nicotinate-nucleotide adenylyltransferase [Paracoccaceae bacterium]|nr:MAG: nicotinate-nucleotide adenylyltransferase [Paracoccaceae bacterium]
MRQGWPRAERGMVIGLLGGSFDPAHQGHAHISREAMKRLGLDAVWWLVSPGNPLKSRGPAPLAARIARARAVMDHPRVTVTDVEVRMGTRFTAATLRGLRLRYPGVRFIWLMGADNLAQFHRWDRWQDILKMVPVAVAARPGQGARALLSPAGRAMMARRQVPRGLRGAAAPAWAFVALPMVKASSSAIRARGDWRG